MYSGIIDLLLRSQILNVVLMDYDQNHSEMML